LARYFFHLRDHRARLLDPEGLELPSIEVARTEALHFSRDLLSHDIRSGLIDLRYRLDVENEAGELVHSLPFNDAFEVIES
jgi:hypothetical protein